tara:strand:+ start:138 stop:488 length:351 start_codon:yes stop_codon:yes gene_type:complete
MKHILTIVMLLTSLASYSQDTLCVMVCLDEVINFNYSTSEIINRFDHTGKYEIKINKGEVLCLHLNDEKRRFREITTTFSNGDHIHNIFSSFDNVIYTKKNWGFATVVVSESKRKK